MDSKPSKPQHPSYRKHRAQSFWQIILPVALAGLLLLVLIYLLIVTGTQGGGDIARWAEVSTMWLTIPFIIGTVILLALLIGMGWLVSRLAGLIPPYTRQAQLFAGKVEAGARRVEQMGHEPKLILPELGKLIKLAFRKIRGG